MTTTYARAASETDRLKHGDGTSSSSGTSHLAARVTKVTQNETLLSPEFLFGLPDFCGDLTRGGGGVQAVADGSSQHVRRLHAEFLDTSRALEGALRSVGGAMTGLKSDIAEALTQLNTVREGSAKILEKAQALQLNRSHCRTRRSIAECLVDRLRVSDKTIQALRDTKVPSTPTEACAVLEADVFGALEDVVRVHAAASQLIVLADASSKTARATAAEEDLAPAAAVEAAASTLGKTAAVDILDDVARLLALAFESLFKICQAAVRYGADCGCLCSDSLGIEDRTTPRRSLRQRTSILMCCNAQQPFAKRLGS